MKYITLYVIPSLSLQTEDADGVAANQQN